MTAFEQAWDIAKFDRVLLYPREFENDPEFPLFSSRGATAFTSIPRNRHSGAKSTIRLPQLARRSRRRGDSMDERDLRLIHDFISDDAHEDMHVAMARIGEFYNDPLADEIPAHIAHALAFSQRPRELNPKDSVFQDLDAGMSPTEMAVRTGIETAKLHHNVKRGRHKQGREEFKPADSDYIDRIGE